MAAAVFSKSGSGSFTISSGGTSTDVCGAVHSRNDGVGWVLDGHSQGAPTTLPMNVS